MFFIGVKNLLHRLELTVHDERLQTQVHIVDVQAGIPSMDVSDLNLDLVDAKVAEEGLEALLFFANLICFLRFLILLFLLGHLAFGPNEAHSLT